MSRVVHYAGDIEIGRSADRGFRRNLAWDKEVMSSYREYRFWSPTLGREAVRLSVVGGAEAARFHGSGVVTQEYFAIIPADETGRKYRDRRNAALAALDAAIAVGRERGEVVNDAID